MNDGTGMIRRHVFIYFRSFTFCVFPQIAGLLLQARSHPRRGALGFSTSTIVRGDFGGPLGSCRFFQLYQCCMLDVLLATLGKGHLISALDLNFKIAFKQRLQNQGRLMDML